MRALLTLLALLAIGGPHGGPVRSVVTRPDTMRLEVGDTGLVACEPRNGPAGTGAVLSAACQWASSNAARLAVLGSPQSARIVARQPGGAFVTATARNRRDTLRVVVVPSILTSAPGAELFDTVVSVQPRSLTLTGVAATNTLQGHARDPAIGPISGTWSWTVRDTDVLEAIASTRSAVNVVPVADGSTYVVATFDGESDSALVTVTGMSPAFANGCPTSGYLRLVNVSTAAEFTTAQQAALPGDQIRLAAGTYNIGFETISDNGTEDNPIVLCGPRTAIVQPNGSNYIQFTGDWWWLRGFTVANGLSGIKMEDGDHNIVDSLLFEHFESMALLMDGQSAHNEVRYNTIRDAGEVTDNLGEGVYIGSGTGSDVSDSNWVHHNTLGPGLHAECLQIRGGHANIIEDNTCDAAGFVFVTNVTTYVWWTGGIGDTLRRNTTTNIPSASGPNGMGTFGASNAYLAENSVAFDGTAGTGYRIGGGGSGNVIKCSNTATGVTTQFSPACTP